MTYSFACISPTSRLDPVILNIMHASGELSSTPRECLMGRSLPFAEGPPSPCSGLAGRRQLGEVINFNSFAFHHSVRAEARYK
jgi:hypothetical protein